MSQQIDLRAGVLLAAPGASLGMAEYSVHSVSLGVDLWALCRVARERQRERNPYAAQGLVSPRVLAVVVEPLARLLFRVAFFVFLAVAAFPRAGVALLFGGQLRWKHPGLLAAGTLSSWFGWSSLRQGQVGGPQLAAISPLGERTAVLDDAVLGREARQPSSTTNLAPARRRSGPGGSPAPELTGQGATEVSSRT